MLTADEALTGSGSDEEVPDVRSGINSKKGGSAPRGIRTWDLPLSLLPDCQQATRSLVIDYATLRR